MITLIVVTIIGTLSGLIGAYVYVGFKDAESAKLVGANQESDA
jgi:hypothetical protein